MNKQITIFSGCLIKENKILLVQRSEPECPEAHMKWEFPGGKVDFGETPQESLAREFMEETGIVVKVGQLLPFVQVAYWDYQWGKQQTLCFCFICEPIGQTIQDKLDHHILKIEWFDFEDVLKLQSLPGTEEIMHHVNSYIKTNVK